MNVKYYIKYDNHDDGYDADDEYDPHDFSDDGYDADDEYGF